MHGYPTFALACPHPNLRVFLGSFKCVTLISVQPAGRQCSRDTSSEPSHLMAVGVHSFQGSVRVLTAQALTDSGFSQSPCDILLTELVCREATSVPLLMERQTCVRLQADFGSNADSLSGCEHQGTVRAVKEASVRGLWELQCLGQHISLEDNFE